MKHLLVTLMGWTVMAGGMAMAEEKRPLVYPFDVTLNEQKGDVKLPDLKKIPGFLKKVK